MKSDPLDRFEKLASLAKHETSAGTDVANRVLQTLGARRLGRARPELEYGLVGFGSFCAACAALLLFCFGVGDDSYLMLVQPFFTELP